MAIRMKWQLLKSALDKAKSVDTSLFEEGADATLSAAIEEAQAVYDNKEATQDEVDAAAAKLERVIASLPAKDGNLAFSATASTSFVSAGKNFLVSTMVLFRKNLIIRESQDTEHGATQVNTKLLLIPGVQK